MEVIRTGCIYFCAASAVLAQTFTPLSNLSQATGGDYIVIAADHELAEGFTTGSASTLLASVTISLAGSETDIHGNEPGPLGLYLYTDNGGAPGSSVAALVNSNGVTTPVNAGQYAYVPGPTPVTLQTNTTYWIVTDASTSGPEAGYLWSETPSANLDAGSSWRLGASEYNPGSGWTAGSGYHYLFSVGVINTNVPSLAISQPILLTYTNVGVPYALQQNSDLGTTNWATVTNVLFTDTISNQVIFVLPPGSPKMFYRLEYP